MDVLLSRGDIYGKINFTRGLEIDAFCSRGCKHFYESTENGRIPYYKAIVSMSSMEPAYFWKI